MNSSDWPELDDAIRRKAAEREKNLQALDTVLLSEELSEEQPARRAAREIMAEVDEDLPLVAELINAWNQPVENLLGRVLQALAADKGLKAKDWHISSQLTRMDGLNRLALYWEASLRRMWLTYWVTVELELDDNFRPTRFGIACKEDGYLIPTAPSLESLKAALVRAYELGPLVDQGSKRKARPGIPFAELKG